MIRAMKLSASLSAPGAGRRSKRSAFTLIDLLAVAAVLAVAALLMVPALARTGLDSRAFQCLNNGRQLAAAFLLYQADNQEFFPPNPDDGNSVPGHNWCAGIAGTGDAQEFNPDMLISRRAVSRVLRNRHHCVRGRIARPPQSVPSAGVWLRAGRGDFYPAWRHRLPPRWRDL